MKIKGKVTERREYICGYSEQDILPPCIRDIKVYSKYLI